MKRKLLSIVLAAAMLVSWIQMPVMAADATAPDAQHWFYGQLTEQGQAIYDALLELFQNGDMKDGTTSLDLSGIVGQGPIEAYLNGNRTLFNDFAAAKDAFDLEHPEAWYVDSSYLSFRVTEDENGGLHAYIGTGRGADYYTKGVTANTIADMDDAVNAAIQNIVDTANAKSNDVEKIKYVHEQITKSISYRFENECSPDNEGFIRTTYALITHEGVCEGYARSFQWVMNELGIPCVLIHGVQTSGEPEDHMWTAVWLPDETASYAAAESGQWYVVDPTWDDPIPLDKEGNIKQPATPGLDGGEHETYLLVGQDITGQYWRPSGYVSTGAMEFTYPTIALLSYGKGALEKDGLKVVESESGMESATATKYEVSFKGMGVEKAAESGYYFLLKMYDVNADGSVDAFDDWYYPIHMLYAINGLGNAGDDSNPYFHDDDSAMTMVVAQAEYVEFAITTKAPPDWKEQNDLVYMGGYYSGNGSDILAESGLIFNANGGYEAPPYVKNVSPLFNSPVYVGTNYRVHMEFTDLLYHPQQSDLDNAMPGKEGDLKQAINQAVTMDYTGTTYAWGVNARQPHEFANKPDPENVTVYCTAHETWHDNLNAITHDCRISTLEYDFSASKMWADDSVQYEFYLTGLVGVKSNKLPGNWSYVFENYGPACAYRCSAGIDWNLWGQPKLLDNPNDLDLSKMVTEGVDGQQDYLDQLRDQMNLDDQDMNGRLVLVVEDNSSNRSSNEELSQAISDAENVDVPAASILASALYEIDFARICRETIVETGQSLRLSIGFPPGFDASMAGITFKAYHFTRDIAGSCDITDPDHVHTGLVTSVQELPITVTQYGLVIICDSFSPFEIVAIDDPDGELDNSAKNTVTLVNDGYGTVTADENATYLQDASGQDIKSIVNIPETGEVTFTVEPIEGYELDTITFSGKGEIQVVNNQFTLSMEDLEDVDNGNAIVNVTFVPKTVHETDAKKGETVVESVKVCPHTDTYAIDENGQEAADAENRAATCEEDGYIYGKACRECGTVLSPYQALPATGHVYQVTGNGYVAPTCTEPGHAGEILCTICGKELDTDSTEIAPLGHSFTSYAVTTPPTCTEPGEETAVCDREGCGATNTHTIAPFGHTYENGKCIRCGEEDHLCAGDTFTDLDLTRWYHPYVDAIVERGLMSGTSTTTFEPNTNITRGMIVAILYRAEGKPRVGASEAFRDVEAGRYYTDAVAWATENNIVFGYGDGTFQPNVDVSRQELAAFLYRYAAYKGFDTSKTTDISGAVDAGDVSGWAVDKLAWAMANGIISGTSTTELKIDPLSSATRAQAARMLIVLLNMGE